MFVRHHLYRAEGDAGGGGAPAPSPAAPAAPAPSPAAGPAPAPAAPASGPASPAPSPAAPSPSPAPGSAPAPVAATWPENWRETVSKADEKRLTQLQRYASPEAAIQALFSAQDRIRSGELKPVLGKNPSADDLKEWRTAHGIPETHDKYDLGKDVVIDDSDKPMFERVFKELHGANATPEIVKATAKAWNAVKKEAYDAQATKDGELKQKVEDTLRAEWGGEFRRNINLVHGLLDATGSQTLKDSLLGGRLADGTPIGSSPEVLKMLVGLALIQNPTGVVVPGGDAAREGAIEDEIGKIEKTMRENRKEYNRDEKLQARYRDLLGAREASKAKAR